VAKFVLKGLLTLSFPLLRNNRCHNSALRRRRNARLVPNRRRIAGGKGNNRAMPVVVPKQQESRMTLKPTPRWMKTALEGAAKTTVAMPWQRGAHRAEMLARRKAAAQSTSKRPSLAAC